VGIPLITPSQCDGLQKKFSCFEAQRDYYPKAFSCNRGCNSIFEHNFYLALASSELLHACWVNF
jgi:hypothetical protein